MYDNNLFGQNFEENFNRVFNNNEFNNSNDDFCSDYSNLYPNNIPEVNTIENLSTNINTNNSNNQFDSEKKKRGRKRKEDLKYYEDPREDNLFKEFKTKFFQIYLIGICNKLIEKYSPNETQRFKKIDKNVINNLNVKPNLKLLNSPLKYFLSFDISDKYKNCKKEDNKNLLKKYYDYNDYFKVLFETTIDALYKIFINDNCKNINEKLFTIESDLSLNYFLNEIDDKEYKNESEKIWKDIYSFFNLNKK